MKTETELKKTWCPMARNLTTVNVGAVPVAATGVNMGKQSGVGDVMSLCIGLACSQCVDCGAVMETEEHRAGTQKEIKSREADGWIYVPSFAGNARHWRRETGERHVYCGQNTGEAMRQEVASALGHLMDAILRINPN